MKEIKYILYTLYVALYTSLWWAVFMFDGLKSPANNVRIGIIILISWTIANLFFCGFYIKEHWNDDEKCCGKQLC